MGKRKLLTTKLTTSPYHPLTNQFISSFCAKCIFNYYYTHYKLPILLLLSQHILHSLYHKTTKYEKIQIKYTACLKWCITSIHKSMLERRLLKGGSKDDIWNDLAQQLKYHIVPWSSGKARNKSGNFLRFWYYCSPSNYFNNSE